MARTPGGKTKTDSKQAASKSEAAEQGSAASRVSPPAEAKPKADAKPQMFGSYSLTDVSGKLGLPEGATRQQVFVELANKLGVSDAAGLAELAADPDAYTSSLFPGGAPSATETQISGSGATETVRPGDSARKARRGRERLPGEEEVSGFLKGAAALPDVESVRVRTSPRGTQAQFKRGAPKPAATEQEKAKEAAADKPNRNPHSPGTQEYREWQTERGLNPEVPMTREWTQWNTSDRNRAYTDQGQRPAFGGKFSNWMAENKPSIDLAKKIGLYAGVPTAVTAGGLGLWDYLDDSENRPQESGQPQQSMQMPRPQMPMGSPAIGGRSYYSPANPAGGQLDPARINRIQQSRNY